MSVSSEGSCLVMKTADKHDVCCCSAFAPLKTPPSNITHWDKKVLFLKDELEANSKHAFCKLVIISLQFLNNCNKIAVSLLLMARKSNTVVKLCHITYGNDTSTLKFWQTWF